MLIAKGGNASVVNLSEQQILDCVSLDNGYYGYGCDGGDMGEALTYIRLNNQTTESAWPYTASQGELEENPFFVHDTREFLILNDDAGTSCGYASTHQVHYHLPMCQIQLSVNLNGLLIPFSARMQAHAVSPAPLRSRLAKPCNWARPIRM
jgi:hypothetical protein